MRYPARTRTHRLASHHWSSYRRSGRKACAALALCSALFAISLGAASDEQLARAAGRQEVAPGVAGEDHAPLDHHRPLLFPIAHRGRDATPGLMAQYGGFTRLLETTATHAYAGAESSVMSFDLTSSPPTWVGQSDPLPGRLVGLAAHGDLLLALATPDDRMRPRYLVVFGIHDPSRPREIARLSGFVAPQHVIADGDTAYVADGAGGVRIVDLSHRSRPRHVGHVRPTEDVSASPNRTDVSQRVALMGDVLFVGADFGLKAVDVSDPGKPEIVDYWRRDTTGVTAEMFALNGKVFVITSRNAYSPRSLAAFELSDTGRLIRRSATDRNDGTYTALEADGLLLAWYPCLFRPSVNDSWCAGFREPSDGALRLTDRHLYAISGRQGSVMSYRAGRLVVYTSRVCPMSGQRLVELRVLHVQRDDARITEASTTEIPVRFLSVLDDDIAYVSAAPAEDGRGDPLLVFPLRRYGVPELAGIAELPTPGEIIGAQHGYAVLAADEERLLMLVDVRDPQRPTLVLSASPTPLGEVTSVRWPYVFTIRVVDDADRLEIIDLTVTERPRVAGTLALRAIKPNRSPVYGLVASTDLLYLTYSGTLQVIDVADVSRPKVTGRVVMDPQAPVFSQVAIEPYLYAIDHWARAVHVFDVADPTAPAHVAVVALEMPRPTALAADGETLYVSDVDGQVWRLDLSDPLAPRLVGPEVRVPTRSEGVRVRLHATERHLALTQGWSTYLVRLMGGSRRLSRPIH